MTYDLGLADRIRVVLGCCGNFTERKMFGGLCFMVNGHMCCGIVRSTLMLRLTPEAAVAALHQPHTRPMDFTGKPIKSMIYVDAAGIDADADLAEWVTLAASLAVRRPAKPPVATRRKAEA